MFVIAPVVVVKCRYKNILTENFRILKCVFLFYSITMFECNPFVLLAI